MSYQTYTYALIGADIGWDYYNNSTDEFYEKFEKFMKPKANDFGVLVDGMRGKFLIVGFILDCSDDRYENEMNKTFELSELSDLFQKSKTWIKEHFDLDVEPKLITISHTV